LIALTRIIAKEGAPSKDLGVGPSYRLAQAYFLTGNETYCEYAKPYIVGLMNLEEKKGVHGEK